jgi:chitinase
MWKMFGPSKNAGTEKRPFGDAFVNGFDLDIETTIPNMGAWAKAMRDLMEQDSPGNYYLSAAPQCPAGHLQDILSATTFDMVFVQYYNNQECSYIDSGNARGPDSYKKSVEAWNAWAANNTKGSSKWFMGLPGGKSAATTGYLEVADMTAAVGELSGKGHFGGVMLWDASQSWKGNDNYYQKVKEVLTG